MATEQPFFRDVSLPVGLVPGDAVETAQGVTDLPPEAQPPDPAAQSAPAVPAADGVSAAPTRCKRCGWASDGRPPDWLKPEEYAGLVEQLVFEGRYVKEFRLGTLLAVTFRTLTAEEEDLVTLAGAKVGTDTNTPAAPVAALASAAKAADDYGFVLSIAAVTPVGGRPGYKAPDGICDPAVALAKLTGPGGVLASGPLRETVKWLYYQFTAGVRVALTKTLDPNF